MKSKLSAALGIAKVLGLALTLGAWAIPAHADLLEFSFTIVGTALFVLAMASISYSEGMWASIAFGIPLAVLALGAFLMWAFSGFAAKRS